MLVQPGIRPAEPPIGSTPVTAPAVRHAPLKKYQLFVVLVPVKSSLIPACASTVNGAPRATSAANRVIKLLRLITNHLGSRRPVRPRKCSRRPRPCRPCCHSRRHRSGTPRRRRRPPHPDP